MKKSLLIICLIFLLLCAAVQAQARGACAAASGGGAPVTEYFGQTAETGSDITSGVATYQSQNTAGTQYLCPGEGTRTIVSIQGFVKSSGSYSSRVRFAVQDASYNTVCQNSNYTTIATGETTYAWRGETVTGTCTCTGGTVYLLSYTANNTNSKILSVSGTSGDMKYDSTDRTGGFDATVDISAGSITSYKRAIRVGVQ